MEENIEYSVESLQQLSYRDLQQKAKAMQLPCNVKKVYMIQMIIAKLYHSQEEVDRINQLVRLERQRLSASSKKKKGRKKSRVQGTEISSTINYTPMIDLTHKRPQVINVMHDCSTPPRASDITIRPRQILPKAKADIPQGLSNNLQAIKDTNYNRWPTKIRSMSRQEQLKTMPASRQDLAKTLPMPRQNLGRNAAVSSQDLTKQVSMSCQDWTIASCRQKAGKDSTNQQQSLLKYEAHAVRPTQAQCSDRVLRSYNLKTYKKPNYCLMNDSVLGVIKEDSQSDSREISILTHEGKYPKLNVTARCVTKKTPSNVEGRGCLKRGNQIMPATTDVMPTKRQRTLSGIQPMEQTSKPKNIEYFQSISIRRNDGQYSKINAVVHKLHNAQRFKTATASDYQNEYLSRLNVMRPNKIMDVDSNNTQANLIVPFKRGSLKTISNGINVSGRQITGRKDAYPHRNFQVTVQDLINSNIDAATQTFSKSNISQCAIMGLKNSDDIRANYPNLTAHMEESVVPQERDISHMSTCLALEENGSETDQTESAHSFSDYCHKKIRAEQVRSGRKNLCIQKDEGEDSRMEKSQKEVLEIKRDNRISISIQSKDYEDGQKEFSYIEDFESQVLDVEVGRKEIGHLEMFHGEVGRKEDCQNPPQYSHLPEINEIIPLQKDYFDEQRKVGEINVCQEVCLGEVDQKKVGQKEEHGSLPQPKLPKITNVFPQLNPRSELMQPLYVQVSEESERLPCYPISNTSMLENLYNFKRSFLTHTPFEPLLKPTAVTTCVYSNPVMAAKFMHQNLLTTNDNCVTVYGTCPSYVVTERIRPTYVLAGQGGPTYVVADQNRPTYLSADQTRPTYVLGEESRPACAAAIKKCPAYREREPRRPIYGDQSRPTYVEEDQSRPKYVEVDQQFPTYIEEDKHRPTYITKDHPGPVYVKEKKPRPVYVLENKKLSTYVEEDITRPTYALEEQDRPTCVEENKLRSTYLADNQIQPPYGDAILDWSVDFIEEGLLKNYQNESPPVNKPDCESMTEFDNSDMLADTTIPEMVEDALELISQDGDYMERIEMDVRMQCLLCSWAGPKIILVYHIRKEHSEQILKCPRNDCVVTYRLGSVVGQELWISKVMEYDGALYALSVKYEDPDTFMAAVSMISPEPDPKSGSITIFNNLTGEPYTWRGDIPQLHPNMPYDNVNSGLHLQLSTLDLLPNRENIKLLNRALVIRSPCKAVVGAPELNDIQITIYLSF